MTYFDAPLVNRLGDGRLHLRHGPIDLVIEAFGASSEVDAARQQAIDAFPEILEELSAELTGLRIQSKNSNRAETPPVFTGDIAIQMARAAEEFSNDYFVTPMVAVAGAVADYVLQRMVDGRNLSRAYVNNGGDIALFLQPEQVFNIGVCGNPLHGTIVSNAEIKACSEIRGIATSGWRGRSHSRGIADSVTVLARTAAMADAAATLIANAIDLPDHPLIKREKASELNPDSDLGDRLVTVDVGRITPEEAHRALQLGRDTAQSMLDQNKITGVYGCLNYDMFSLHKTQPNQIQNESDTGHSNDSYSEQDMVAKLDRVSAGNAA